MKCHKNVSLDCVEKNCPMWFESMVDGQKGDCSEALMKKNEFWEYLKTISEKMAAEEENNSPPES